MTARTICLLTLSICISVTAHASEKKKCPAEKAKKEQADKKSERRAAAIPLFQREAEFPADAKAGECYVRVRRPAKYREVEERVVIREASVRYEVIPATFRDAEKKILIKPESKRFEVVPAKFEQKLTNVVKVPEYRKIKTTAAKFTTVKERVETKPETVLWKKGEDPLAEVKGVVGNVWCLVRDVARYEDYTWQKLTGKAVVKEDTVEAEVEKIPTMVLVAPARVKEVVEPAKYKTVKVRELVKAAHTKKVPVPAEYKVIRRQVLVRPEEVVWQRVLCDTNVTADLIRKVQSRLKDKKYDCGRVHGKLSEQTRDAIRKYQQDHKLSTGGLTYEFLDHLEVKASSEK